MFIVILGMVIDAYTAVYSMCLKHFIYKQTLQYLTQGQELGMNHQAPEPQPNK